jgi:thioester reductase-like protein
LIIPAREGTLRVLRAAQKAGIKRVVLVSSVAAVISGHERENRVFTESDWTDTAKTKYAYAKSKTLAERAAWEFVQSAENRDGLAHPFFRDLRPKDQAGGRYTGLEVFPFNRASPVRLGMAAATL